MSDEGLHALWTRVDVRQPLFTGDDIAEWPDGCLDRLMAAGLLRETANAQSVVCDACAEGHVEEVQLVESPPGSGFRAYVVCPENGRVRVPLARLRQWAIDLSGLARAVAAGLPAAAGIDELSPGRVWLLGRTALGGQSRDVFLLRGAAWPDFPAVLAGVRRFQEVAKPVVLVAGIAPAEDVWGGDAPTVFAMSLLSRFEGASLTIDRDQMNRVVGRGRRATAPVDVVTVPTPHGAKWQDLSLIVDDLDFVCHVSGKRHKRTFQQAGFRNRVKGEYPDRLWGLLLQFALGGGELAEESLDTKTRNNLKQYVSELRERLRMVFAGIENDDPIVKPPAGRYRTAFAITAKDGITLGFPVGITWSGMSIAESSDGNIRFTADVAQRYRVYSDGQVENRGGEMAEGPAEKTKEHNLQTLGLLGRDRRPNRAGKALLDVLRGGGRVERGEYDRGMEDLSGILHRITGIESAAFSFHGDRGEWNARFEASSERAST